MRVLYSTVLLASENLALGRVGFGATWNGEPIIDPVAYFRAANTTVFGRGDGPETFGFRVWRFFASEAAALLFCGTHRSTLPVQADLVLVNESETIAMRMADAVRAVQVLQRTEVAVLLEYKFTGSLFQSDDVPEDSTVPSADTVKTGYVALSANDETATIAFDVAFGAAPKFVCCQICPPTGSGGFDAWPIDDTIASTGFTAKFGGLVPGAGYKLRWTAIL